IAAEVRDVQRQGRPEADVRRQRREEEGPESARLRTSLIKLRRLRQHGAQASSAKPRTMSNGALIFSKSRIESMPRHTTTTLAPQKKRKQPSCGAVMP